MTRKIGQRFSFYFESDIAKIWYDALLRAKLDTNWPNPLLFHMYHYNQKGDEEPLKKYERRFRNHQ